jgi:hypothetical protein
VELLDFLFKQPIKRRRPVTLRCSAAPFASRLAAGEDEEVLLLKPTRTAENLASTFIRLDLDQIPTHQHSPIHDTAVNLYLRPVQLLLVPHFTATGRFWEKCESPVDMNSVPAALR